MCRNPKGCRLPTGGGSRERRGKVLPQAARTDTGLPSRQVTALRTGNRKLSTNPYREVGGEIFRRRVLHGVLSLREPCAGKLARTVLRGLGDGNIPRLPDITVHAVTRKGADFRQVADHGKDEEKFYRRQHGQTPGFGPTGDGAADGNRKLSKNPYREVGGFSVGGCFTASYRCVSRVRGNLHARFSGGLGGWQHPPATRHLWGSASLHPTNR
ncbi:hypothetical protein QUF80_10560 [Desulfococcaceae bacterium HSG8]|nr:hypothetical protein [Desulfococcaceae bacterium HSG8]